MMGSGMVIDLEVLIKELEGLERINCSYNNLRISKKANLILPYHKVIDRTESEMKEGRIGTTGRGIGPAYADRTARKGVRVGDLKDENSLLGKLKEMDEYHRLGMSSEEIGEMAKRQLLLYQKIKEMVCDTDALTREAKRAKKRILLEGAQGLLLSVDYGTYPYTTSSDCSRYGLAKGAGLLPEDIDIILGVVKFPFMTRVGKGPFPTEYGGRKSEEHCAEGDGKAYRREIEEGSFGRRKNLINDKDEFLKGIGVRLAAGEYGATTGRPRRIGRTDLVALKYAIRINGEQIILTKPDCVKEMETIELGTSYIDEAGREIKEVESGEEIAYGLRGAYKSFKCWGEISGCEFYHELPRSMMEAVNFLEERAGARVRGISNGAERRQFLVKNPSY